MRVGQLNLTNVNQNHAAPRGLYVRQIYAKDMDGYEVCRIGYSRPLYRGSLIAIVRWLINDYDEVDSRPRVRLTPNSQSDWRI